MKKLLPLLLAVTLLLTACGKLPQTSEATTSETATETPSPETLKNPLTGETVDSDRSSVRPYAVMLNNINVALPQCGVSQCDILYEVLAEGNITRLEGIFTKLDGVGAIGSMRSARPYYITIAQSYDAIYVHAGGSEQAYSDISSKNINDIDGVRGAYATKYFYRDKTRQKYGIEHSMFTTGEKLLSCTQELGYRTDHDGTFDYGLTFSDSVDLGTETSPAATVNVSFGGIKDTGFSYHSDTGYYTAKEYGSDYIDGTTQTTVNFKNLVVLFADTSIVDDYGRRAVQLVGTGTGYFMVNGKSVPITWSHASESEPFVYEYKDGTPVTFGIGKTYIGVVPTGSNITMS
jgi:hypothetical protein